jgi:undecaprenyl-diphosphatase
MLTLVLLIAALIAGLAAAAISRRTGRRPEPPGGHTARPAAEAIARGPAAKSLLSRRLDPEVATGLALTVALVLIVGGGLVLAVLAYLVRGDTDLVRIDRSVAEWGDRHATAFSSDVLDAVTTLGEPTIVAILAAVVAVVETLRTRSRWVVPFLLVVVAGNGILTTTVKHLADRVRPDVNPIAETLGPSFPSGHSSWSIAFFAATALLMSRGRGRSARALIAGAAAALTVMVAGSRVLLGVHWLSDVLAGLALGAAWFAVCAIAFGGRLLRFGAPAEEAVRAPAPRPTLARRAP